MLSAVAAVYITLGVAFLVLLHERLGRGRGGTANPIEQALGTVTLVLLWPLVLVATWGDLKSPPERIPRPSAPAAMPTPAIPHEWLQEPATLEEAEAEAGGLPAWNSFVQTYRPGDVVWRYGSDVAGPKIRSGFAIVRDGQPIAKLETMVFLL